MSVEKHIVGFRVGRETYGVPITALHEIVRVPEITAVPDAPDYLEGVINLRGKIVSVVDLRKRFGQPSTSLDRRSRILVVEYRGRLAGMIVDSASEVLKIPESEIEAAPADPIELTSEDEFDERDPGEPEEHGRDRPRGGRREARRAARNDAKAGDIAFLGGIE